MKAFLYSILMVMAASSAMAEGEISCRQEIALKCGDDQIDACQLPYSEVHQCISATKVSYKCASEDKKYVIHLQNLTFSLDKFDSYGGVGKAAVRVNRDALSPEDVLISYSGNGFQINVMARKGTLYVDLNSSTLQPTDATYFPGDSDNGAPSVGIKMKCSKKW